MLFTEELPVLKSSSHDALHKRAHLLLNNSRENKFQIYAAEFVIQDLIPTLIHHSLLIKDTAAAVLCSAFPRVGTAAPFDQTNKEEHCAC